MIQNEKARRNYRRDDQKEGCYKMNDTELRKTIGSRAKARRKELGLTMDYLAEKLDVNKSTIMRYEKGTIDNTKRLVVEGLANALHVTPEYLRGETDEYNTEITDRRLLQVRDLMEKVLGAIPLGIASSDNEFAENMLLVMLAEYLEFADSFTKACHRFDFDGNKENEEFAKMIGESLEDFSSMLFQREIMHTVSTLYDVSETLRSYVKDPQAAQGHMRAILKLYNL